MAFVSWVLERAVHVGGRLFFGEGYLRERRFDLVEERPPSSFGLCVSVSIQALGRLLIKRINLLSKDLVPQALSRENGQPLVK